jgi:hypothetical protein
MDLMNRQQIEDRLLSSREVTDSGCWIWTRSKHPKGYGQTFVDGRNRRVSRLAAALWLGFDLDSQLLVMHRCDNPPCFNPEHLFIGTAADNSADMVVKGRAGNKPFPAKVTPGQRLEIVRRTRAGETQRAVGREYGISHSAVQWILKNAA